MVRLYMDENVRGALTRALRQRGVDVVTAQEDGHTARPDPDVLDRATELGRVLFTYDDDLLREAARRQREGAPFAGVIFAHQTRVPLGLCVAQLTLIAEVGEPQELENLVEYLPL